MRTHSKIVKLPLLKKHLARHRLQGKNIAFTNGCFDIVHAGHVSYLQAAKKENRILIVGLNSDRSVKSIKGPDRPVNKQRARSIVLAALACVDYVIIFDEDTPARLIGSVMPDILIKGADWKGKEVAGRDTVKNNGGRIEFIKFVPGISSTGIINRMAKSARKRH